MTTSQVYFCNMRTLAGGMSIPEKLKNLIREGGIAKLDLKGKFVAIKMHFGEPGNIAYLRPQFPAAVAEVVKELGGSPLVKDAYVGRALRDADVIISLSHFKGHEMAGFGGCLKNLGMGGASIAGKRDQHSGSRPQVEESNCIGCGLCTTQCAYSAVRVHDGKAHVDHALCVGCGRCVGVCPQKTIHFLEGNEEEILNKKIAEYAYAVLKDKPSFHVNVIMDVSPNCDCHGENDAAIIPDVGMLCSFDPVAIDAASADLCLAQPVIRQSAAGESAHHSHDCFCQAHPNTDWRSQITHAEEIGLGSGKYVLTEITKQ